MENKGLKKNLSFISMIAIASGAVIGGWLAESPYWFSTTGAGAGIIFPILAILLVPIGLAFSELTAMLPFASAVDVWTTNAMNHRIGWLAQWLMFLVQVVEPPLMAFIFITAINYFVPIPPQYHMFIAISIIVLWFILSNFNIELTGKLANVFFFSMIAISLLVCFTFYFSGNWHWKNIVVDGGLFSKGSKGVLIALAVLSLKFIGFELTPTMIEETNFPVAKMWKVILSALFIPAFLYFVVVMAMGGMAPASKIAVMQLPEPEIVSMYGLPKIIGGLAICSGILHAMTTLMGFWTSSSRVIYGAAQLNQLPKIFAKLNKRGQPYIANIAVLIFSIFFCFFTGDNWVQYIYAVSCIAGGLVYFVCCLDAIILRKKHPEWKRPYTAPFGTPLFILGMAVSIWIVIGSSLELNMGGWISLGVYCLIGFIIYLLMKVYRKGKKELQPLKLTPNDIGKY